MTTDYASGIQKLIGRKLTKADEEKLAQRLIRYAAGQDELRKRGTLETTELSLNDRLQAIKEVYGLKEKTLAFFIDSLVREEKDISERNNKERALQMAKWRSIAKRGVMVLGGAIILGAGVGIYHGTYSAAKDKKVEEIILEYKQQEASLENKRIEVEQRRQELDKAYGEKASSLIERFFGPLDELTTVSKPSALSPLETDLYLENILGDNVEKNIRDQTNTTYDKTIDGVRIQAKEFKDAAHYYLVILKETENGIATAHIYGKVLRAPLYSIFFEGREVKVIDHRKNSLKILEDNVAVYKGDDTKPYDTLAEKIFKEFEELKNRGPNTVTPSLEK